MRKIQDLRGNGATRRERIIDAEWTEVRSGNAAPRESGWAFAARTVLEGTVKLIVIMAAIAATVVGILVVMDASSEQDAGAQTVADTTAGATSQQDGTVRGTTDVSLDRPMTQKDWDEACESVEIVGAIEDDVKSILVPSLLQNPAVAKLFGDGMILTDKAADEWGRGTSIHMSDATAWDIQQSDKSAKFNCMADLHIDGIIPQPDGTRSNLALLLRRFQWRNHVEQRDDGQIGVAYEWDEVGKRSLRQKLEFGIVGGPYAPVPFD